MAFDKCVCLLPTDRYDFWPATVGKATMSWFSWPSSECALDLRRKTYSLFCGRRGETVKTVKTVKTDRNGHKMSLPRRIVPILAGCLDIFVGTFGKTVDKWPSKKFSLIDNYRKIRSFIVFASRQMASGRSTVNAIHHGCDQRLTWQWKFFQSSSKNRTWFCFSGLSLSQCGKSMQWKYFI